MNSTFRALAMLAIAACAAWTQSGPSFEVASIKPAPPPDGRGMRVGQTGGPGTPDPGRWSCENMSLSSLVTMAYALQRHQYSGPDWMDQARFNIQAKVPAGATRDDVWVMVQNLLSERFKLVFHREKKEVSGFELVIAKNGPKLKEALENPPQDAAPPPQPTGPLKLGADGYPDLRGGVTMAWMNGRARWHDPRATTQRLAGMLAGQLRQPVVDGTGLKGKYDMTLSWVSESNANQDADSGPVLFTALSEQLGLKVEAKKMAVDVLVVDKAEESPTEN